jgi:type II secretory pathway pseudopilin PulG
MKTFASTRRTNLSPKPSEEGYILVMVILLVALLTIALAVAMPKITKEIQRDHEVETLHRGKQYIRAIKLYYKKFGAYPPTIDALVNTNNIRFLRKKYKDPITGKDDWKPIPVGMNKAPTVMGFFGVPLGTIGGCGATPSGSTASTTGTPASSFDPPAGGPTSPSSTGSLNTNCVGNGLSPSGQAATNPDGSPVDPNAANTSGSTAGQTGTSTTGLNGQSFGSGPIMGYSPASPKQSIIIYKTKDHYNQWEFVYDPNAEQLLMTSGGNTANTAGLNQLATGQNSTQSSTPTPPTTTPPASSQ